MSNRIRVYNIVQTTDKGREGGKERSPKECWTMALCLPMIRILN